MSVRFDVVDAICASWTKETSAVPHEWTPDNPARGQCDASAFVLWEIVGGNLVLAEVYVDGERTEHHYWNRVEGEDIDLTRGQFLDGEDIREKEVLPNDYVHEKISTMRPELRKRIDVLRASVATLTSTG